jgi:hypothetical protein
MSAHAAPVLEPLSEEEFEAEANGTLDDEADDAAENDSGDVDAAPSHEA